MTIMPKKHSKLKLFVLRILSYIPGVRFDLGLSTSEGDKLLVQPNKLTAKELSYTVRSKRKPIQDMDPEELATDELDRQARFDLINKLKTQKLAIPNSQLLNIMNFDGPPRYVPKTKNTVFVLSGHSLGKTPVSSGGHSKLSLENLVDGTSIEVTREQLESFFQKVP